MREKSIDTNIIPSHTLGKWKSYSTQNLSLTSNPRSRRHLRSVAPSGFDYGRYLPPLRMTQGTKPFLAWIPPRLSSLSVAKDLGRRGGARPLPPQRNHLPRVGCGFIRRHPERSVVHAESNAEREAQPRDLGFSNSPKFSHSTQYPFSRVCAKKASLPTSFPRIHSERRGHPRGKAGHSHQTQDSATSATCRPCGVRLRQIPASTQNDAFHNRHHRALSSPDLCRASS